MTIDEAIYHLQELADSKFEQMRRYDRASGYAISHNEDIRTADAKRLEQRAKECIQLAKWLRDYKEMSLAIEEIKSLGQSRRILLMKGDEVLHLVEDIIDRHISGKENI